MGHWVAIGIVSRDVESDHVGGAGGVPVRHRLPERARAAVVRIYNCKGGGRRSRDRADREEEKSKVGFPFLWNVHDVFDR